MSSNSSDWSWRKYISGSDVGYKRGSQVDIGGPVSSGTTNAQADHVTDLVHWTVVFLVTPAISVLGILGNTMSLIILTKHGFRKSSNILLFSLAVSDILFLVGVNGPVKIMYEWSSSGFRYPEPTAHALYYLYQLTDSLNWTSGPTSLFIPVLIMIERLIAVFLPLRFPSIVTVRRTVVAVVAPLIFSVLIQAYLRTWYQFVYIYDRSRNCSVGMVMRSDTFWAQRDVARSLEIFFNSFFVLVIFVGCGCVAISVKLKLVVANRMKMTNMEVKPSRTTKMMLCLCIFYTLASAPAIVSAIVPRFMVFPILNDVTNFRSLGVFIYHIYQLAFSINASCNFLIYVATNNKFRDTFLNLVCRKASNSTRAQMSSRL